MKRFILFAILFQSLMGASQTHVEKSMAVALGERIQMQFDYPDLIKVTTWDRNEVRVSGEVSINMGMNDDAFELQLTKSGNTISINNTIRDLKNLPEWITVIRGDKKITFNSKTEYRKYVRESGSESNVVQWGVEMEIMLEVKVPRNTPTEVESVYGMVEVAKFEGPIMVDAKYGGVDASLREPAVGQVVAETSYGQIYSNLDTKFDADRNKQEDFYMLVTAKPGRGPSYSFASTYGNVYLRKEN